MSSVTELFDLIQNPTSSTSVAADRWIKESEEHPWFALGHAAAVLASKNSGRAQKPDAVFFAALNFSSRDRLKSLLHGHIPDFPLPELSIEAVSSAQTFEPSNNTYLKVDRQIVENGVPEVKSEPNLDTDTVSGSAWSFTESEEDLIAEPESLAEQLIHKSPVNEVHDEPIKEVEIKETFQNREPVSEPQQTEFVIEPIAQTPLAVETKSPEPETSGMSLADRIMAQLHEVEESRKRYLEHMTEEEEVPSSNLSSTESENPNSSIQDSLNEVDEPQGIADFQANLIDKFIEADPKIRISIPPAGDLELVDLAQDSYNSEPEMVTETLAQLFVKQGKPEKAREVYNKLISQYPEKADYFQSQLAAFGL